MYKAFSVLFLLLMLNTAVFPVEKLVLFDFEKDEELNSAKPDGEGANDPWVFSCEISDEHATSGKKSLKVIPKAGAKWLVFSKLPTNNWSSYDLFKFDIFSSSKNRLPVFFVLSDWQALPCTEEYKCLGYPFHQKTGALKPGRQTIEFSLNKLATIDSRFMFVEDTKLFAIGFNDDKTSFYVDNIRLEKKEEAIEEQ